MSTTLIYDFCRWLNVVNFYEKLIYNLLKVIFYWSRVISSHSLATVNLHNKLVKTKTTARTFQKIEPTYLSQVIGIIVCQAKLHALLRPPELIVELIFNSICKHKCLNDSQATCCNSRSYQKVVEGLLEILSDVQPINRDLSLHFQIHETILTQVYRWDR